MVQFASFLRINGPIMSLTINTGDYLLSSLLRALWVSLLSLQIRPQGWKKRSQCANVPDASLEKVF